MTTSTTAPAPASPSEAPPANANSECVGPSSESAGKASACAGCPNQSACASGALRSPEAIAKAEAEVQQLQSSLSSVSHTILVLSGKGGVGKSTVAAQLAHTLAAQGYAVGLLDVDLCGPSAPRMVLGESAASQTIHRSGSGLWIPVYSATNHNLAVVSISFLLQDRNQAVIWRGPRKNALILQFLSEVDWTGETEGLDYLIVDTPPGTSDEHISTVQYLQKAGHTSGAVVVTTPEEASLADVRKELSFCQKTKVPVLGVIENMGTFETRLDQLKFTSKTDNSNSDNNNSDADCTEQVLQMIREKCPELLTDYTVTSDLFTVHPGMTAQMAAAYQCDFWGSLPLDPALLKACEEGQSFVEQQQQSGNYGTNKAAQALTNFCQRLTKVCPVDMAG